MKKHNPAKLSLRIETVKSLSTVELAQAAGGATNAPPCKQPTTTFASLERC